jgi:hypothetical protein
LTQPPVGIAPEQAAADSHRRDARDIGAVAEGRAHHVELVLDAPDAAGERADVQLALESPPRKVGVALRIDRLVQFKRKAGSAGPTQRLLRVAGEATVNEAVELGVEVVAEPEGRSPSQSDLDRLGGFDAEIGIADVEGAVDRCRPRENNSAGLGARSTY